MPSFYIRPRQIPAPYNCSPGSAAAAVPSLFLITNFIYSIYPRGNTHDMKKAIIFLLVLLVGGCYLWYRQGEEAQKAETLIWAAYDGDLTGVKNALEDGAPLNWLMYISDPARHYQSAQFTPLLAAASGGNKKVLLYLIKQGQNPSQANIQGWTPLFIAVRDGHAESAAQLVYAGANPNIQTDTGATALILAMVADFTYTRDYASNTITIR